MERCFLGLGSKNKSVAVKEGMTAARKDSAASGTSAMQWSFSNKVSASPQYLSFKANQDDGGPRKMGFDSLSSTRFMTISSAEAFESNHKLYSSIVQKNLNPDKQAGTHYTVTNYPPKQFDALSRPHEARMLPMANQTNQKISIISSAINPQPLRAVPVISSVSVVPMSTSVVGTTDLRNSSKPSGGPAQLTIFYAGSVCVYDNVSPEKAQAIMLLAGNGHSSTPNKAVATTQVEVPVPRPSGVDNFIGNQSRTTSPCLGLPSPISVTTCATPQSVGGSSSSTAITAVRAIGTLASTSNKSEPSKGVSSRAPVSAPLVPSAVPQARKASLARFLEKRKERAMNASPYVSKQSPNCSNPGLGSLSFSMNTGGSFPLQAII
ncbi:Protein TIFY 6B [Camellia lanceoleosa]|uniref:Protein TIFY 6B n=1 Tax=Camellia lanceoleosa TaxID=1840588 RepID=A0ACC0FCZ8_9ERIC|nr:Protein TIFY 6B [Camellia lanceoleosa]